MKNTKKIANPSGLVYNFVLDRYHIVLVNGMECVTWGHGLTEAGVQHEYYGSQKIIKDLVSLPGWSSGSVSFTNVTNIKNNVHEVQNT